MKYIQGQNRNQTSLFPITLEDAIEQGNEVRIIDLFVSSLKLEDYGFKTVFVENGKPAYHPGDLLRLYIYGYLNKIRSSRDLEKECKRNIEVMWLLNSVFRETARIAQHFNLIGGKLLAGDSTKFRHLNCNRGF